MDSVKYIYRVLDQNPLLNPMPGKAGELMITSGISWTPFRHLSIDITIPIHGFLHVKTEAEEFSKKLMWRF